MSDRPDLSELVRVLEPSFEPWQPRADAGDVAVLMSGGVDSSLSAALLKEAGRRVVGVTMKVPRIGGGALRTPAPSPAVLDVCRHLGIPHYFMDIRPAFERFVLDPFRAEYAAGRTPNPCVNCNQRIKFGLVCDAIEAHLGVRHVATGHYARIVEYDGRPCLARGRDRSKDQSYFMYRIPPARLPLIVFPLGEMTKPQVRSMARERGLPVADADESMELCFAGDGDYRGLLLGEAGRRPGPIVDTRGRELGRHEGIAHYTVGQRRGLRVAAGRPLYVVRICPDTNTVVLGPKEDALCRRVTAVRLSLAAPERIAPGARLTAKLRSAGDPAAATILESGPDSIEVEFDEPQFAPTPGQSLVLYDGDAVLGGGFIER